MSLVVLSTNETKDNSTNIKATDYHIYEYQIFTWQFSAHNRSNSNMNMAKKHHGWRQIVTTWHKRQNILNVITLLKQQFLQMWNVSVEPMTAMLMIFQIFIIQFIFNWHVNKTRPTFALIWISKSLKIPIYYDNITRISFYINTCTLSKINIGLIWKFWSL